MNIFMVYENFNDCWSEQSQTGMHIISYHSSEEGAKAKVAYFIGNNNGNNILIPEIDDECEILIFDYQVIKLEQ